MYSCTFLVVVTLYIYIYSIDIISCKETIAKHVHKTLLTENLNSNDDIVCFRLLYIHYCNCIDPDFPQKGYKRHRVEYHGTDFN